MTSMPTYTSVNSTPVQLSKSLQSIRIGVSIVNESFQSSVLENSAPKVLDYDTSIHVLSNRPKAEDMFCLYNVQFEAKGFTWQKPSDKTLEWLTPHKRPPFIAAPTLNSDGTVCSLLCVNAADGPQVASFQLVADLLPTLGTATFDPTIVNNPDGPPE